MKKKLYYSIGEVCEIIDVKSHIIRYWESEIPRLKPKNASVRNRRYDEKDIALLKQLKELIYEKKYTLEGAKIAINEYKKTEKLEKKEKKEVVQKASLDITKESLLEQLREIRNYLMNK